MATTETLQQINKEYYVDEDWLSRMEAFDKLYALCIKYEDALEYILADSHDHQDAVNTAQDALYFEKEE